MLLGKDMAAPGGNPAPEHADYSSELIITGRYAEAFRLLDRPGENSVAGLFNLALCHIYGGDNASALIKLEQALSALRQGGTRQPVPESPTLRAITVKQNSTDAYMRPFTDEYVRLFPDVAQDSILRLTVDCHLAAGNSNKVLEIGTPLSSRGYANITAALEKAIP